MMIKRKNAVVERSVGGFGTIVADLKVLQAQQFEQIFEGLRTHVLSLVLSGDVSALKLIFKQNESFVKRLVAEPTSSGQFLIHAAVSTLKSDMVLFLLSSGSPVNPQDKEGNTPIRLVVKDLVSILPKDALLVDDPDEFNNFLFSALQRLILYGCDKAVNKFVSAQVISDFDRSVEGLMRQSTSSAEALAKIDAFFKGSIRVRGMFFDKIGLKKQVDEMFLQEPHRLCLTTLTLFSHNAKDKVEFRLGDVNRQFGLDLLEGRKGSVKTHLVEFRNCILYYGNI